MTKVLPPGVGTGAGDAGLRFEYTYDATDRMSSKKVPDMNIVNMKYNLRDQLVLVQDGNQLAAGKWMMTQYDAYGRPTATGLYTGAAPNPDLVNTYTFSEQHTATTYGISGIELGKVKTVQTWIPGLQVSSVTRTFTYNTTTGRVATDNGGNHLGTNASQGSDNYAYTFDYAGNPLTTVRTHKTSASSPALTLTERYTYDHAGRKTAFYHQINNNTEKQLAGYTYDYRDRLIDKGLGAVSSGGVNSYLQSVDYAYNQQNWLTAINGPSSFGGLTQQIVGLCSSAPVTPSPTAGSFSADPDGNDLFKLNIYYDSTGLNFGGQTLQRNGNIPSSSGKSAAVSARATPCSTTISTGSRLRTTPTSTLAEPLPATTSTRKTSVMPMRGAILAPSPATACTKPPVRLLAGPSGK